MFGGKATAKGGGLVDRALVKAVLHDPAARLGRSSVMPAYPQLSEAEREALLKLLESLGVAPASGGHERHPAEGHK
jgi:hypothetical protein